MDRSSQPLSGQVDLFVVAFKYGDRFSSELGRWGGEEEEVMLVFQVIEDYLKTAGEHLEKHGER